MTKDNSKFSRARRHREAEQRQSEYNGLTVQAKIQRAVDAPGDSERELDRFDEVLLIS